MIKVRWIILTDNLGIKSVWDFDSTKEKDSEALHRILCQIDPGDEYTVQFTNKVSI